MLSSAMLRQSAWALSGCGADRLVLCRPVPVPGWQAAKRVRHLGCRATAQQLEGVASWLAAGGAAKAAVVPTAAGGLQTSRAVSRGEQLFAVPQSAWITAATAQQSAIGRYLEGLEPWVALSLFLLHERSAGAASRWAPYLAALPADSGSPVQWASLDSGSGDSEDGGGDEAARELAGTQTLVTAQGYRAFFLQRYQQLALELLAPNPAAFDPAAFTPEAFLWAACTVRARSHAPLDGANIALVPLADMVRHRRGAASASWQVKQAGGLFGAGSEPTLVMVAPGAMEVGEPVTMDFAPDKSDGQVLVDHGVFDLAANQGSYALSLDLSPEADRNYDDKADVLEINGLPPPGSTELLLRADAPPDARLLPTLRLFNLQGPDAFLLESIFRNECWEHMQLPVSEANERRCYQQLIEGCGTALAGYPTTIDDDLALLAGGELQAGSRRELAVRVRLGEKEALDAVRRYFEERIDRLGGMEYYADRRLKRLGLLDDEGKTTWDGFFSDGIA